jgi:acetyl esterase/lipase
VIGGDSAGGGLTAATLLALRDAGDPLPAGAFLISPWLDLTHEGESMTSKAVADPMVTRALLEMMADAYAGAQDLRQPLISPVFADLGGLPPMLVQVGTAEVLLDDSTRFAERAKAAGVDVTLEVWDEMIHVWHVYAEMLPEAQQAVDRIGEWVRARVTAAVAAP